MPFFSRKEEVNPQPQVPFYNEKVNPLEEPYIEKLKNDITKLKSVVNSLQTIVDSHTITSVSEASEVPLASLDGKKRKSKRKSKRKV